MATKGPLFLLHQFALSVIITHSGASNKELERFTLRIASTKTEIEEISKWFKKHSVPS